MKKCCQIVATEGVNPSKSQQNQAFLGFWNHSHSLLGIVFNGFCFINLIPHFFDYLMCPYYPAYTMGCYQIVIGGDNGGLQGCCFLWWFTTTFYHERQGNAITILAVAYQGILLNIWRTLSKRLFGRRGWMTGWPTAAWYPFSSVRHTLRPLV